MEVPKSKIMSDGMDLVTLLMMKRDPLAIISRDGEGNYAVTIPQGQFSGSYKFTTQEAFAIEETIPAGKFVLI